MWFLEHESAFGAGRRQWLRPGSQYLFGRTKAAKGDVGQSVFIDHKAVSRKHMMIKVLDVPPGDGVSPSMAVRCCECLFYPRRNSILGLRSKLPI